MNLTKIQSSFFKGKNFLVAIECANFSLHILPTNLLTDDVKKVSPITTD